MVYGWYLAQHRGKMMYTTEWKSFGGKHYLSIKGGSIVLSRIPISDAWECTVELQDGTRFTSYQHGGGLDQAREQAIVELRGYIFRKFSFFSELLIDLQYKGMSNG